MALASSILFVSCSNDDDSTPDIPLGIYDNGVLIVNEGGTSGGTISFINNDLTAFENNIFNAVNPSQGIGIYVQSIFFDGDRAFIVSNGSNKITVVINSGISKYFKICFSFCFLAIHLLPFLYYNNIIFK